MPEVFSKRSCKHLFPSKKRSITQDGAWLFSVKLFLTILCLLDRRLEHIMTSWVILFQFGTSEYSKHSEVLELAFHMYTVNPLKRETCSFLPPEITHVCLWNLVWVRDAVGVWSTGTEQGVMQWHSFERRIKGVLASKHWSCATDTCFGTSTFTNVLYLDTFMQRMLVLSIHMTKCIYCNVYPLKHSTKM